MPTTGRDRLLANHITLLREAKGLSQSELARQAGVKRVTLAAIEKRSSKDPGVWTVHDIAAALGVTIDQLLDEETAQDLGSQWFSERFKRKGASEQVESGQRER